MVLVSLAEGAATADVPAGFAMVSEQGCAGRDRLWQRYRGMEILHLRPRLSSAGEVRQANQSRNFPHHAGCPM